MKIVVFGLTVSSSWGNGHATLWRGLCRALDRMGHSVVFFERDVPYYAGARDVDQVAGLRFVLYPDWESIWPLACSEVLDADVAVVTSYCPDGVAASELIASSARGLKVFYDLDTPVTLARLSQGETLSYVGPRGLADFDLVLSFTGGRALEELRTRLGARLTAPLYGHVDPETHRPAAPLPHYRADLSYLGTFSSDRQSAIEKLLIAPAQRHPERRFLIAGAQYPHDFPWCPNLYFVRHLPPSEHANFFSSSRLTLNITRAAMARMGWCPSGRLFEAAACGTPMVTDAWDGLDAFFAPQSEILVIHDEADIADALHLGDAELARIGHAARERVLAEHTSEHRAKQLVSILEATYAHARRPATAEA